MNCKRMIAAVLMAVLLVSLAGCSVREEDVIGVWQREPLYMEYYGCNTEMVVSFAEDGSFSALLLAQETHNILNYAGGTWTLDGDVIVAERTDGGTGTMEFGYDKGADKVLFEGYEFARTE